MEMIVLDNEFSRTELLLGAEGMKRLAAAKVAVFGVGGVGSYVAEALARSGVGSISLFDNDIVSISNINRQLIALHSTLGEKKTEVMKKRILDINPAAEVKAFDCFYLPENSHKYDFSQYDYIADAVDTITAKLEIITNAKKSGVSVISCMGAGNKLNPLSFAVTDIYETSICPLAKVMRHELRKRCISSLKVVCSTENAKYNGRPPASIAFIPSVAGLIMAGEIIKDISKNCSK